MFIRLHFNFQARLIRPAQMAAAGVLCALVGCGGGDEQARIQPPHEALPRASATALGDGRLGTRISPTARVSPDHDNAIKVVDHRTEPEALRPQRSLAAGVCTSNAMGCGTPTPSNQVPDQGPESRYANLSIADTHWRQDMGDANADIRRNAISAAMQFPELLPRDALMHLALSDVDIGVRIQALAALGLGEGPEASQAAQAALSDPDVGVRAAAEQLIAQQTLMSRSNDPASSAP